jgi:Abnormal spindle-like microcephaly-assoc'd, ASPM-SPD-2-Hydin
VTLTNNTSDPIPFASSNLAVNGSNAADFASPSNTCGTSIAAGASCTVSVTFTPSVAAAESATLVITVMITDGGLTSSQSFNVSLSGTGSNSAPGVGLAPTSLSFGGQLLTTTSAAQTVTLTNTGTSSLTINSIAASGDFKETNTCGTLPATLAASANCTISVTFAPTAVGARTGTLTITDNAGGSPHTVPLTGTGWDFMLTAQAPVPVKAGQSVNFNVTMTPLGGFNQAVALACSGAPKKSTCTIVPTSVTASDGVTAQTAVATFSTQALIVPPPATPAPPISIRQVVPLVLALVLLLMLLTVTRLRTRLGMVTAILILLTLAGCGSYNGTKKGPAALTITGTSGGVTKTATVTVTVQ